MPFHEPQLRVLHVPVCERSEGFEEGEGTSKEEEKKTTFKKVFLPKGRFACGRESEEAERVGRTPSDSGEEDMLM